MRVVTVCRLLAATLLFTVAVAGCAPMAGARAAETVPVAVRDRPYPRDDLALAAQVDEGGCRLPAATSAASAWEPDLDLRGDPGFDPADLPAEVRCWYEALWTALLDPDRAAYFTQRAARADLYTYSREVNNHLVALLTAFRVTGDLALLDEVDRLTQHMRAQLRDSWQGAAASDAGAVDGYLNWVWDRDHSDSHRGRDLNEIDEMRTHAALAQVAYAFRLNAELESPNGVDYAERAGFWTSYLRDHFEAKWRERRRVPWPRFPFLERPHLHETIEFARYHHYMHLLTGEEGYEVEARRLSRSSFENFREVDTGEGPGLVTPRSVLAMGGSLGYMIPNVYFRHVVATLVDLHFEGYAEWGDDTMEKVARAFAVFVLDGRGDGYARDLGGGRERAGIPPSGESNWSRVSTGVYNVSPFALLSPWDGTGEVAAESLAVHLHRGQREWNVFVPTGLLLDAALRAAAGGRDL